MLDQNFEERFAPEAKQKFAPVIASYDAKVKLRKFPVDLAFFGVNQTIQEQIQEILLSILEETCKTIVETKHIQAKLCFYSQEKWESKINKQLTKINLPAAKINFLTSIPTIDVIILNTNSLGLILKVVRLALSKLFGALWFYRVGFPDLHVLNATIKLEKEQVPPSEKIAFMYVSQYFSEDLIQRVTKQTKQKKTDKNIITSFLLGESKKFYADPLLVSPSWLQQEWHNILLNIQDNKELFFEERLQKSFAFALQFSLILPHEKHKIEPLLLKGSALFSVVKEKANLLFYIMEEIEQAYHLLIEEDGHEYEAGFLENYITILKQRRHMLLDQGYALLFFGQFANKKEEEDFTFWLLRNQVVTLDTVDEKKIVRYTEQYKNSIYQKLFDLLDGLLLFHRKPSKQTQELIKQNMYWLRYKKPLLRLFADGSAIAFSVMEEVAQAAKGETTAFNAKQALTDGWAYFISFVLLYAYLKARDKQGEAGQAEKWRKAIENYLEQHIKEPIYTIGYFFMRIYFANQENLLVCVKAVQEGLVSLDFLLEHHSLLKQKNDFLTLVQEYAKI